MILLNLAQEIVILEMEIIVDHRMDFLGPQMVQELLKPLVETMKGFTSGLQI